MAPNVILASGAAVAVTVAVAAAVALYENPELRRYADDLKRRVAIAMTGEPPQQRQRSGEPMFNRPEDAEGFMMSGGMPGVDADEETKRRQREELLYWNSVRLEKERKDSQSEEKEKRPANHQRGSSFDDFMTRDHGAEHGAFVFNSGAQIKPESEGLRQRGEANRAMASAMLANPFADEYGIASDEIEDAGSASPSAAQAAKDREEILSDIYSVTTRDAEEVNAPAKTHQPNLIDISEEPNQTESSATLDNDEYMTASQDSQDEAYASIQAWAQNAAENRTGAPTPNFYSPLPVTPLQPVSEPDLVSEPGTSDGQLTPTDSVSVIGSAEVAEHAQRAAREDDVISESEGMLTPASWSEVGSVVSEYEVHHPMPGQ